MASIGSDWRSDKARAASGPHEPGGAGHRARYRSAENVEAAQGRSPERLVRLARLEATCPAGRRVVGVTVASPPHSPPSRSCSRLVPGTKRCASLGCVSSASPARRGRRRTRRRSLTSCNAFTRPTAYSRRGRLCRSGRARAISRTRARRAATLSRGRGRNGSSGAVRPGNPTRSYRRTARAERQRSASITQRRRARHCRGSVVATTGTTIPASLRSRATSRSSRRASVPAPRHATTAPGPPNRSMRPR